MGDGDPGALWVEIDEELLSHVRGGPTVFDGLPRCSALYDTAFNGLFRVEVCAGEQAMLAVEHVADGTSDWRLTEYLRRSAPSTVADAGPDPAPVELPARDAVTYRSALLDVDAARAADLLAAVRALDWGEPTPSSGQGRDGVTVHGTLHPESGEAARRWTTWSPDPDVEPAKAAFFHRLWRFAVDNGPGALDGDLDRVGPYLALP
ncbi:MAG: hypothetical protein AAGA59_10995 [Actinomycetota bacterium]